MGSRAAVVLVVLVGVFHAGDAAAGSDREFVRKIWSPGSPGPGGYTYPPPMGRREAAANAKLEQKIAKMTVKSDLGVAAHYLRRVARDQFWSRHEHPAEASRHLRQARRPLLDARAQRELLKANGRDVGFWSRWKQARLERKIQRRWAPNWDRE